MKTYLKISSFLLAICLIFNAPLSILANNTTKNSIGSINIEDDGVNVGIDITQDKTTIYSESIENDGLHDTLVFVSQASTFSVSIPKTIILDGLTQSATYLIMTKGNISGEETINVKPNEKFLMSQFGKNDIEASVVQDKIEWKYNELEIVGNGIISTTNMTAGMWNGQFDFYISLQSSTIKTFIVDKNGNDLNGKAYNIEGEQKEDLLTNLEKTNFIDNKENVDALIEVKTNDFENISHATFDVSNIADTGDKVVILHYNEETQEWEYIGTDIVDEYGQVEGDFTSYSPVAFIVIKEDGTIENINHEHKYSEYVLEKGTCETNSLVEYICDVCSQSYQEEKIIAYHNYENTYHTHQGSTTSGGACYTTPIYHSHNSSTCYRTCGGGIDFAYHDNGNTRWWDGTCRGCGATYGVWTSEAEKYAVEKTSPTCKQRKLTCTKVSSSVDGWKLSCTKTNETLEDYKTCSYCGITKDNNSDETHIHKGNTINGGECYATPIYHTHSDKCYGACGGGISIGYHDNGNTRWWDGICNKCGATYGVWTNESEKYEVEKSHPTCQQRKLKCGKSTTTIESWALSCPR